MINLLKKKLHSSYRKYSNYSLVSTVSYYLNNTVQGIWDKNKRSFSYNPSCISETSKDSMDNYDTKQVNQIKIAFVCDEMTYINFQTECQAEYLTPNNWFEVMEIFKPDIFFCESTWSGIEKYRGCWRGRIYKNKNVKYENRKDLLNILDYCSKKRIKTVFWNKEDPTFYENLTYNFVDTALKFDYIFTTSKECVEKYKSKGHKNVNVLMFGFSPVLYNPMNSNNKENKAIFAGSWYENDSRRCSDMKSIFQTILNNGIELNIYDRNYNTNNSANNFPSKYKKYIKGKVKFKDLGDIIKKSRYALNINTVTDSETMFARRVFELMACNVLVISNHSIGMKKIFGKNVWFIGEDFNKDNVKKVCSENVDFVFQKHTNRIRMEQMLNDIGINCLKNSSKVSIIYTDNNADESKKYFESIVANEKEMFVLVDRELYVFKDNNNQVCTIEDIIKGNKNGYCILADLNADDKIDFSKLLPHFSYISDTVGIKKANHQYMVEKNSENRNVVYKINMLTQLIMNEYCEFEKYYL